MYYDYDYLHHVQLARGQAENARKSKVSYFVLFHSVLDFGFLMCLLGNPDFDFDLYIVLPTGVALMEFCYCSLISYPSAHHG
jgi:hypothetical protein